ncbi:unannotated protein [freshwater metagenome]|uniref:Unannotated protein n=1 Tax=freshwater metagenome TaxID=449393 RepID=A0A6J7PA42_9ZZZZ
MTRFIAAVDCSTIVGSITGGNVVGAISIGKVVGAISAGNVVGATSTGAIFSPTTVVWFVAIVVTGAGIEVVELVVVVVVSIVVDGKKIGVAINSIEGETASNLLLSLLCD